MATASFSAGSDQSTRKHSAQIGERFRNLGTAVVPNPQDRSPSLRQPLASRPDETKDKMAEAGGVGIFSAIENTQLIDFSRRSKTLKTAKLRPTGTHPEREILPWPLGSFNFRGAGVVELDLATIY
jgi:hypothetical protein